MKLLFVIALCAAPALSLPAIEVEDKLMPLDEDIVAFDDGDIMPFSSGGDDLLQCGETFTVKSPGFPSNYPANTKSVLPV